MKKRFFLFAISLVAFASLTMAQNVNTKMGNPTMDEMNYIQFPDDPEAEAVVLYAYCYTHYEVEGGNIKLQTDVKKRIKILKEDGKDYADVELTVRDDEANMGYHIDVRKIKANAFNLTNGKIVKTQMESSTISKQRIDDNYVKMKFSVPQVSVGTVIEYSYTLSSELYFNVPTYYAQSTIPVVYTKYELELPEEFTFHLNATGVVSLDHKKEESHSVSLDTNCTTHIFVGQNLPGVKTDNTYVYCLEDYFAKVTCELNQINIPGTLYKNFTTTWEDVDKQFLSDDDFGARYKQNNPLKKEMEAAGINSITDVKERVSAVRNILASKVRWNENYSLISGNSASKVLKEGTGDNSDINFLYMAMLRDANIKSYPVLLNRRNYGRLPQTHPSIDAFGTFVVGIFENDSTLDVFDASAMDDYINVIPEEMNVDQARLLISDGASQWINLQSLIESRRTCTVNATVDAEGKLSGNYKTHMTGISSHNFREAWKELNDSAKFVANTAEEYNIDIDEFSTAGRDQFTPAVDEMFSFTKQLDTADGKIYLPLTCFPIITSPYTVENTTLPVETPCISRRNYIFTITIPDGYHTETMPKNLQAVMDGNKASMKVISRQTGNTISVSISIKGNTTFFTADEYPMLRTFYSTLVDKCNEMIVLVKE